MIKSFFLNRHWMFWAWGGLAFLVAIIWLTVHQTVLLNAWYGEFYNLLQKPEQANGLEKFWGFMREFAHIAFPFVFLRALENYFSQHYAFRWRQAITFNYLPFWMQSAAKIEGASQRLQEDCMRFARLLEVIGLGFVRAILTLISFIPILWVLSANIGIEWLKFSGSLVWLALLTALGGTVISWFVGVKLPGLEYNNQKVEAAFRKDLVYGEDNRSLIKMSTMVELFTGVRINNFRLYNHYAYFNLWSNLYGQTMLIIPYLMMGPSLFMGIITLGVITQVSNAFGTVNNAFSYLIDRWTEITELRSIYKRLKEFEVAIELQQPWRVQTNDEAEPHAL